MYDDAAAFFFPSHGDFPGDCGLVEKAQNTFEDCLTRVPFLIKLSAWLRVRWSPAGEVSEYRDAVFCEGGRRVGGPDPPPRPVSAIHASAGSYRRGLERTRAVMCRPWEFTYVSCTRS